MADVQTIKQGIVEIVAVNKESGRQAIVVTGHHNVAEAIEPWTEELS